MSATVADAPRVAMASYGDLAFDSRVQREAIALADAGYHVTLLIVEPGGELPPSLTSIVEVIARYPMGRPAGPVPLAFPGPARVIGRLLDRIRWALLYRRDSARWGRWAMRRAGQVRAWHLHDFPALTALAPLIPARTPFVYDSHELFLESGSAAALPRPLRAILRRQERRLAGRAAALVTVNDACADALAGLGAARTVVVHNYPAVADDVADDGRLRRAAGVPVDAPLVISHGALTGDRGLEQLVDAIGTPQLAGVHLVCMGFGDLGPDLLGRAMARGVSGRVHVLPAVPPDDVVAWVTGADVSAMPIQPSTLNHRLATPNKLFESLAAGVPVVASDFPAMAHIVLDDPDGPLGAVSRDPTEMEAIASAIPPPPGARVAGARESRARCRRAAKERMSWPHAAARLVELYRDLLRNGQPGTGAQP